MCCVWKGRWAFSPSGGVPSGLSYSWPAALDSRRSRPWSRCSSAKVRASSKVGLQFVTTYQPQDCETFNTGGYVVSPASAVEIKPVAHATAIGSLILARPFAFALAIQSNLENASGQGADSPTGACIGNGHCAKSESPSSPNLRNIDRAAYTLRPRRAGRASCASGCTTRRSGALFVAGRRCAFREPRAL